MKTFIRRGRQLTEPGLPRRTGTPALRCVAASPVEISRQFAKFINRSRQITQRWLAVCTFVLAGTIAAAPGALAQADPVAFINQGGVQAIQVLGRNVPPAQRLARFRELFAADFDVAGLGQFALGQYWSRATPQQQQEYLRLFREYVVQALSARSAEYAGEQFRAISARQNGGETIVTSEVTRSDGSKIPIDWYLVNRGGWKITDVYVAGVSIKVTGRDEIASVMQQGGGQISYLLDRLRQKVGG
jgi:phospholipid transport system substrate-binding protein